MTLKRITLLVATFFLSITMLLGQEFPEKTNRLVNDYTNTLSESEEYSLEQKLISFNDSTSTQIAVVLMRSVGVYDINDFTARLAEKWGVGQRGKNNGVVLLVALEDRKVSIQTGYGVEGALPDAIAKRIIENEVKPNFQQGNYYQGIEQATDAIIAYTKGEYKNDQPQKKGRQKGSGGSVGILIIILIIILISRRGGGGGRGGQIIGSRGGASPFWWMLMGSQMGRSRGGGWGGFSGGGGGFGGGGGGFGGFGGGSFGGGGASGSW